MHWLVIGLASLVCLLLLVRWVVSLRPSALFRTVRLAGGAILLILAGLLLYARRFGWAYLVGANAFSLFRGRMRDSTRSWGGQTPPRSRSTMNREEAYQILGLERNASVQEIRSAHRRLIAKLHPDQGGGDYLARKINEARDVLLKE